jgi:hypothetical protein
MSVLYGLHGLNTNDVTSTDVITNWLKSTTRNGRSTTIVIDHTHKGAEKGSMPIGSQHKISMVQGTAIQVVPVLPPRPGALGHVELVVGKDRPGGVRAISSPDKFQVAADVYLDSTRPGVTKVSVMAPKMGDVVIASSDPSDTRLVKRSGLANAVWEVFANHPGARLSKAEVDRLVVFTGYSPQSLKRALDDLVSDTVILQEGKTKGTKYYLPTD